MKNQDLLIIGAVGVVLLLATKKSQAAKLAVQPRPGGYAQPGTMYATPTQTAAAISGAVNGILNWLNPAAPSSSSTPPIMANPVDSGSGWLGDVSSAANNYGTLGLMGSDGSLSSTNPQNGSQLQVPSLANTFWFNGTGALE